MKVVRVFPRKTSMTPSDSLSFVGPPPLFRPEADAVHVSVAFTWDVEQAKYLKEAWSNYYPRVFIGGPAMRIAPGNFEPGLYVKPGVVFTSRGCNNHCPWCLVPETEGPLRVIPIREGYIEQSNNLLQCPASHRRAVFKMLNSQRKAAVLAGGLDTRLITDEIADELRGLRIKELFLAADTEAALSPLAAAIQRLSFLPQYKLRCYVLIAYGGETPQEAETRLRKVYELGALPFAQLYQPPDDHICYNQEWKTLQRNWSRPAITKSIMEDRNAP